MPRSPRQDYEGAWQHAMNRGIDRQTVCQETDAETLASYAEWQGVPWGQTRRV